MIITAEISFIGAMNPGNADGVQRRQGSGRSPAGSRHQGRAPSPIGAHPIFVGAIDGKLRRFLRLSTSCRCSAVRGRGGRERAETMSGCCEQRLRHRRRGRHRHEQELAEVCV